MPGPTLREVGVRLSGAGAPDRSYRVLVGTGILGSLGARCRALFGDAAARAFLVADDGLPQLTIDMARDALRAGGFRVELATVTATEPMKSIETAARLCTHMAAFRLERDEPVVALGGGIVGDLAGFAASMYRRGVPVVQCPTTLLAMVDASVGGKTGANLAVPTSRGAVSLKKNLVGAFHQPALVMCDVSTLNSLAPDELRCGLAECIKHALIGADWDDAGLFDWTVRNAAAFVGLHHAMLGELVARNVAIKARVVEGDEREERTDGRGRMSLNMGHTVGHAIETLDVRAVVGGTAWTATGLKHGEAVGLGLIAEAACGEAIGVTRPGFAEELRGLLERLGLPTRLDGMPPPREIVAAMRDDKKVAGARIRMAIPTGCSGGSRSPAHAQSCASAGCVVVTPDETEILGAIQTLAMKSDPV